jgi:hypothetical protein
VVAGKKHFMFFSRQKSPRCSLGGGVVAGALGRKILQQERGIRSVVGWRQEKIAAGARRKHVRRWQVKIAAGARRKLALSSARASMLLGSKLRGGQLMQQ